MSSYDEHLISQAGGDWDDNRDQPPEVDVHDEAKQSPPAVAAAERILEFVAWFGDGDVAYDFPSGLPLYARDLEEAARAILESKP